MVILFRNFVALINLLVCAGVGISLNICMPQCICKGQRTTSSQFSPSTMFVPGFKQIVKLGGTCPYLMTHIDGLKLSTLYPES